MKNEMYFKNLGLRDVTDEELTHCLQSVRWLIESMTKKISFISVIT